MKLRLIWVLVIAIPTIGCDPIDDKLKVTNLTGKKIFFLESEYEDLRTMYKREREMQGAITFANFLDSVEPNSTKHLIIMGGGEAWERYINNCEDGKLRIYTFSDTLMRYGWKYVLEKDCYIKKMEFTVSDLDKLDWEISLQ